MKKEKDNTVFEEEIYFYDKEIFGDSKEYCYDVKCYDGYGICTKNNECCEEYETKAPQTLRVVYPKMCEVMKSSGMKREIRDYRGLHNGERLHYGDIMVRYGTLEPVK